MQKEKRGKRHEKSSFMRPRGWLQKGVRQYTYFYLDSLSKHDRRKKKSEELVALTCSMFLQAKNKKKGGEMHLCAHLPFLMSLCFQVLACAVENKKQKCAWWKEQRV